MNKIIKSFVIAAVLFVTFTFPVLGQYDSDDFDGIPSENGEIFGINVEEGESATIFPSGCDFIESVTLKVKKDIKGSVEIVSYGEKNPKEAKGIGKKVVEYCEMKFQNFSKDDIESSVVKAKLNKNVAKNKDVKSEDVRLFQYDEGGKKWEEVKTAKKSESSVNFFYESESVNKYNFLALGEKTSGFNLNYLPFIICGFLLLLVIIVMLIAAGASRRREEEIEE